MSLAVIRTLSPDLRTDPSTIISTFSSLAICGRDSSVFLDRLTDVLDVTRRVLIWPSSEMRESVIPSAKESCAGAWERLCRGRTASDCTPGVLARPDKRSLIPAILKPNREPRNARAKTPVPDSGLCHKLRLALRPGFPAMSAERSPV